MCLSSLHQTITNNSKGRKTHIYDKIWQIQEHIYTKHLYFTNDLDPNCTRTWGCSETVRLLTPLLYFEGEMKTHWRQRRHFIDGPWIKAVSRGPELGVSLRLLLLKKFYVGQLFNNNGRYTTNTVVQTQIYIHVQMLQIRCKRCHGIAFRVVPQE